MMHHAPQPMFLVIDRRPIHRSRPLRDLDGLPGLAGSDLLVHQALWMRLSVNTLLLGAYIIFVFRFEITNGVIKLEIFILWE